MSRWSFVAVVAIGICVGSRDSAKALKINVDDIGLELSIPRIWKECVVARYLESASQPSRQ